MVESKITQHIKGYIKHIIEVLSLNILLLDNWSIKPTNGCISAHEYGRSKNDPAYRIQQKNRSITNFLDF